MYRTQQEIKDQFQALDKTLNYINEKEAYLMPFYRNAKKVIVFGCGSSYMLAKSAAFQLEQMAGIPAVAIAAGDYLVNKASYKKMIQGSSLISISRSGSTSEIIRAVRLAKDNGAADCLSVCARENAEIAAFSEYHLDLPWCYDTSVCQTRTVTNLYAALLMSVAVFCNDQELTGYLMQVPGAAEAYQIRFDSVFEEIAGWNWKRGVVLADAGMAGIAEEGALAFKEICQCNSNYYHLLDSRHGPMVMIGPETLVLALVTDQAPGLQYDLLRDIRKKGAPCVYFDTNVREPEMFAKEETMIRIQLPCGKRPEAAVLFMMYGIQSITCARAVNSGINPDEPNGLDAWIELKEGEA